MNKDELIRSLTPEQRMAIAAIIRGPEPSGDYHWNGEDSVWGESVAETLDDLAWWFETYDPSSVLPQ